MHLCTHFIHFFLEFAIFLTIPRCGLIIGHHLCQSSALLYGPRLLLSVLGLGRNLFVRSESKFLRLRPLHWQWRGAASCVDCEAHHSVFYCIIP